MGTPSLPTIGEPDWGTPLNDYLTNVVMAEANQADTAITAHVANSPPDPHGDRAYALGLVSPIINGADKPGGFVELDNTGHIPATFIPPGANPDSFFDVVRDYLPGGVIQAATADVSTYVQQALDDCNTAGGGVAWFGDGTYAIGTTLRVYPNTHLLLTPGAVFTRVLGSAGTYPVYMAANYDSSSTASGDGNISISGGAWNFATQSSSGAIFALAAGTSVTIRDTILTMLPGNPAAIVAGCTDVNFRNVQFYAAAPSGTRTAYTSNPPAVRVESVSSTVLNNLPPAWEVSGSANYGLACSGVRIDACDVTAATASDSSGAFTVVNGIAGTTVAVSGSYHNGIMVTGCTAPGFPGNAVNAVNWNTASVVGNIFNVSGGMVLSQSWVPSGAPAGTSVVSAANTPPAVAPTWQQLDLYGPWVKTGSGVNGFWCKMTEGGDLMLAWDISPDDHYNPGLITRLPVGTWPSTDVNLDTGWSGNPNPRGYPDFNPVILVLSNGQVYAATTGNGNLEMFGTAVIPQGPM